MRMTRSQPAREDAPMVRVRGVEDGYHPHVLLACGHYVEMRPKRLKLEFYELPGALRCNDCGARGRGRR